MFYNIQEANHGLYHWVPKVGMKLQKCSTIKKLVTHHERRGEMCIKLTWLPRKLLRTHLEKEFHMLLQTCLLFIAKLQDRNECSLHVQKRSRGNNLRGKPFKSVGRPPQCVWIWFLVHCIAFVVHL